MTVAAQLESAGARVFAFWTSEHNHHLLVPSATLPVIGDSEVAEAFKAQAAQRKGRGLS